MGICPKYGKIGNESITKAASAVELLFILLETVVCFMENIGKFLQKLSDAVWGIPTILFILGTGIYFTIKSDFFQIRRFPEAWCFFCSKLRPDKTNKDGVSAYQALCTALAATVGTGNIAGVAGAICLGGPGSVFWMWISAFLGMIIKCVEASLSVRFREKNEAGEYHGGPMQMIENGLGPKWKWLAVLYAFFGVVAAFGVGNATQINAVLDGIGTASQSIGFEFGDLAKYAVAVILSCIVALMLSGGAKRIGKVAEAVVPWASAAYIILGMGVLVLRYEAIPNALYAVISGAFSPKAVTGGVIGTMFMACRTGAARGIFTNEAGMGTASIAHAAADVNHPVQQGFMGIIEVFLDTIVICTITALVILCSGIEIPYGVDTGAMLTSEAFSAIYGDWVRVLIALFLICFALATVLGWGYYGLRCAQYLFGYKVWRIFVVFQVLTVLLGAILNTRTVWQLAEIVNGLMAVPNLLALILLRKQFLRILKSYEGLKG